MTKEEKIKESWAECSMPKTLEQLTGCYWFRCKRSQVEHLRDEFDFITWDLKECSIRPKSLEGIENNNGWIKIESEADLPKENSIFWTLRHGSTVPLYKEVFNDLDVNYWLKTYTHYHPIEKPKPPIY